VPLAPGTYLLRLSARQENGTLYNAVRKLAILQ
jgi:hypothetical protein